jgi:hypothetical protein
MAASQESGWNDSLEFDDDQGSRHLGWDIISRLREVAGLRRLSKKVRGMIARNVPDG